MFYLVDSSCRFKKETEDLKAKLQLTLNELTKSKTVVEQERSENSELSNRIVELEQMLDDMSKTCDSKDLNMTEMEDKVKELEKMLSEKSVIEEELEETKRRTSQLEGKCARENPIGLVILYEIDETHTTDS